MSALRAPTLDVLLLSPYHGGSHAAWAEGVQRHCRNRVRIESLPARFWKWRMHGAAITLARRLERHGAEADVVLATDMLDLATFVGLSRGRLGRTRLVLYMHENQVTYPLPEQADSGPMRRQLGERDRHYGFINLTSMLAADHVAFNSEYHRRSLLDALPPFLRHFPDYREIDVVERLRARSSVIPVGIDAVAGADSARGRGAAAPASPRGPAASAGPLILWNQRWEYDKNPAELFTALRRLAADGATFRVALCGERFGRCPPEVETGIQALGARVVHDGFLPRGEYETLLRRADVVVSTADHEFLGVAVLEAVGHGAMPILPARLSYPEVLPAAFHESCLYEGPDGLVAALRRVLGDPGEIDDVRARLPREIRRRFGWADVAPRYDELFERLVARGVAAGDPISAGRRSTPGS